MTHRVLTGVLMCLALMSLERLALSADDSSVISGDARPIELLFLDATQPVRWELAVDLDGQTVPAVWNDSFRRLFHLLDRDDNAALNEAEAMRLPTPFTIRQILWGRFAPPATPSLKFNELDADGNAAISFEEMRTFYRQAGLGDVFVGIGRTPATDLLTGALLKRLDTSHDGRVDQAEWKAAPNLIPQLDANDDERINPSELVAQTAYPGAVGSLFLRPPRPGEPADSQIAMLPVVLVPRLDAGTGSVAEFVSRISPQQKQAIGDERMLAIFAGQPTASCSVRFITTHEVNTSDTSLDGSVTIAPSSEWSWGSTRFSLRADPGKLAAQTAEMKKTFEAQFVECDANSDGHVDAQELAAPRSKSLRPISSIGDRNSDEILTRGEFDEWWAVWRQLASGQMLLSVIDYGRGLFELLDTGRDGALSARELRAAEDVVRAADCLRDGHIDATRLPYHLRAVISHGHPQSLLGQPTRRGPDWFLAMDRNQDGELSRTEFAGSRDQFDKLDANHDGFLDRSEVAAAK